MLRTGEHETAIVRSFPLNPSNLAQVNQGIPYDLSLRLSNAIMAKETAPFSLGPAL